jgi:hypothetical protein
VTCFPAFNIFFLFFMKEFPASPPPVIHVGCVLAAQNHLLYYVSSLPENGAATALTHHTGMQLLVVPARQGEHFPFFFFK